jgi:hydrogenase nickel incorporation protein HypA/HybF
VAIGALSGVEREPFEFCFPLAARGTPLEGARLEIEEVPVTVRCTTCQKDSHPEFGLIACALCGSSEVEITAGRDFIIRSLEVR